MASHVIVLTTTIVFVRAMCALCVRVCECYWLYDRLRPCLVFVQLEKITHLLVVNGVILNSQMRRYRRLIASINLSLLEFGRLSRASEHTFDWPPPFSSCAEFILSYFTVAFPWNSPNRLNAHFVCLISHTDVSGSRHRHWNTRQFGPRGFIISTGLLSTVRRSSTEHNHSIEGDRRRDSILQCVGRHKIQFLAVLHEYHASQPTGMDRIDYNRYVHENQFQLYTFWPHPKSTTYQSVAECLRINKCVRWILIFDQAISRFCLLEQMSIAIEAIDFFSIGSFRFSRAIAFQLIISFFYLFK